MSCFIRIHKLYCEGGGQVLHHSSS